ncbi:MAG: glycosyltransferase family 9 protein [Spirochaetia bacterium]|nr:glycosyltransferase family 9 protein [Spirochaetia bacterium]
MKVLFFRLGAIGDTLLTTPAVKAVKEAHPDTVIHYMAGAAASKILLHNPYIDRLIVFEEKHTKPRWVGVMQNAAKIKKELDPAYDLFIDFESSYYSAYVSMLVNAGQKIGFYIGRLRRWIYNPFYSVRVREDGEVRYAAQNHMRLVEKFIKNVPEHPVPVLKLSDEELARGMAFYTENKIEAGKAVLGCISASWTAKKWPVAHWIELARTVTRKSPFIVLWGPGDEADAASIKAEKMDNLFMVPNVKLRELAAIMAHGRLLVSNDSGVRHIGVALGLKTIGLFGPTNEKRWALPDRNTVVLTAGSACRPCDAVSCADGQCMRNITPEQVAQAVKRTLNFTRRENEG